MSSIWVPMVAIVMGIGLAFWHVYWEFQQRRIEYDERRMLIEKGLTPLPLLPDMRHQPPTLEDSLRRGVILFFLGVGLAIAYLVLRVSGDLGGRGILRMLAVGAPIVLLLGTGNLVYYVLAKRGGADSAPLPGPENP